MLTKIGATKQLRTGVQQHLNELSKQLDVNISITDVDRFGMIIFSIMFINFFLIYKMDVLLPKQLYHHTQVDKILLSLFTGQNPILENKPQLTVLVETQKKKEKDCFKPLGIVEETLPVVLSGPKKM